MEHAHHVLATLEQFQTTDTHTRSKAICYISKALTLIERDVATKRTVERLNRAVERAEEWLATQANKEVDL